MSRSASHIIHSLAAAIAALLLAACAADRCDWVDADSDEGATYLSLRVFVSGDDASTRSDGTDDEAPEGRLPGNAYENAIDNITIFFAKYDGSAIPENDKEIEFEDALYIDLNANSDRYVVRRDKDGSREVLIRLNTKIVVYDGEHSMVVVANHGDLTQTIGNMKALREKIADYAWDPTGADVQKTGFVMSSFNSETGGMINPIIGDPTRKGSKSDPYYGECTLMRLASRIDLCCSKDEGGFYGVHTTESDKTERVKYTVTSEKGVSVGEVYLLAAEMVNSLYKPSYILRHTYKSSDIDKLTDEQMPLGLSCGGLMTADSKKEELNYVIDPNFLKKNETATETTLNDFFGSTRPEAIKNDVKTDDVNRFQGNSLVEKFIKADLTGESYEDKTFDRSLTIGYVNENLFKAGLSADKFATGLCFKAVFVPSVVYTEAPEDTDESLDEKVKADYAYGDDFWHVHVDTDDGGDDVYFSNEAAAFAYKTAHSGTMTHHPGGVSYYHIWIRHSKVNDENEGHAMYYGIVRNNIYRVLLTFKGPGFNQPFESDIPTDVVWKIYTRGWNLREWNMVEVPDVQL